MSEADFDTVRKFLPRKPHRHEKSEGITYVVGEMHSDTPHDALARIQAENERLREALEFYAERHLTGHETTCLRHPMHWPDEYDETVGWEREVGGPDASCSCRYARARAALKEQT